MVKVPTYEQTERLRPAFQQDINVRATPDAFGAAIGRGMKSVGAGGMQMADSIQQVNDLKATLSAKDSLTAFEREKMELDYGQNGFLTMQGRNAVEGRDAYNRALEDLKKKHAPTAGEAAQKYDGAATAAVTQGMRSGIIHAAQGQKDWAQSSSTARLEIFKDQAMAGYDRPDEVKKSIALGYAEIGEQASLSGWGSDVVDLKRKEFATTVHSNVAIALASKTGGARKALDYLKANGSAMDNKTRMEIETKLQPFADDEAGLAVVNDIMSSGRKVSEMPGDMVGEVAGVTPEKPRSNTAGPRASKAFLHSISNNKSRMGDTLNLDNDFSDNLSAMIQDAPPEIRKGTTIGSAYRSNERQKELFAKSDKTGVRVAFPAGYKKPNGEISAGSNHLHGRAVDLNYNGQSLAKAPQFVKDWFHQNAGKYGMRFPMSWEPWHIEPSGGSSARSATAVPERDGISFRSSMPSYGDAMERINKITDPNVRASAIKQLNSQFDMRSKAEAASASDAKASIWEAMLRGSPLSAIPIELKIAAGREAMSGFSEYESKAGDVSTNPEAYSALSTLAATNPDEFAKLDMTAPEIINALSRADWKAMSDKKTSILGDERKAREDALVITSAYSQASQQLEAVGITTTGKDGSARTKEAKRIADFQRALSAQMEEFQREKGRAPNQMDIQSLINRLLLPVVIKEPGTLWGTNSRDALLFEGGMRSDASTIDVVVKYSDIPIELRRGIGTDLERDLGRKPSEEEIVQRYKEFILNQ